MKLSPGNCPYSVPRTRWTSHLYRWFSDGHKWKCRHRKNHCNLLSYLTLGQHATHSDGELEAMNIALMWISCRIWTFEKAVILTAAIQATGKVDAPPSETVSETDLSVKPFKNLKKDTISMGPTPLWSCRQWNGRLLWEASVRPPAEHLHVNCHFILTN